MTAAPDVQRTRGLAVLEERVLVEVPRPRTGEALRVTHVRAEAEDGREVAWISVRLHYRDSSGALRPAKAGVTVRLSEAAAVAAAIARAASTVSTPAPANAPRTGAPRQARLPGVRGARRGEVPFVPPPLPPDDGVREDEVF